jgi:uncharacterized protein YhhL (DUF1145 family)
MKIYTQGVLLLLNLVIIFGLVIPFMVSYPDDLAVIGGFLVMILDVPLVVFQLKSIFKSINKN